MSAHHGYMFMLLSSAIQSALCIHLSDSFSARPASRGLEWQEARYGRVLVCLRFVVRHLPITESGVYQPTPSRIALVAFRLSCIIQINNIYITIGAMVNYALRP